MPRLVNSHTGVVVNVDDELGERLRGAGWRDTDKATSKTPAKKAASSKSPDAK